MPWLIGWLLYLPIALAVVLIIGRVCASGNGGPR